MKTDDEIVREAVEKAFQDVSIDLRDMLGIHRFSCDDDGIKVDKIDPSDFYIDDTNKCPKEEQ